MLRHRISARRADLSWEGMPAPTLSVALSSGFPSRDVEALRSVEAAAKREDNPAPPGLDLSCRAGYRLDIERIGPGFAE